MATRIRCERKAIWATLLSALFKIIDTVLSASRKLISKQRHMRLKSHQTKNRVFLDRRVKAYAVRQSMTWRRKPMIFMHVNKASVSKTLQ